MTQKSSYTKSNGTNVKKNSSSLKNSGKTGPISSKNKTGSSVSKGQVSSGPVKPVKKTTDTPVYLKFVYAFMLLLMLLGGVARVAGKNSRSQTAAAAPQAQGQGSPQSLSAKALTLHREDGAAGVCDDLIVTVSGDAVLTACSSDSTYQYHLSAAEQQQLASFLGAFKPFDFDSGNPDNTSGVLAKLSMNGHGTQVAAEADLKNVLGFASMLDSEIEAQQ